MQSNGPLPQVSLWPVFCNSWFLIAWLNLCSFFLQLSPLTLTLIYYATCHFPLFSYKKNQWFNYILLFAFEFLMQHDNQTQPLWTWINYQPITQLIWRFLLSIVLMSRKIHAKTSSFDMLSQGVDLRHVVFIMDIIETAWAQEHFRTQGFSSTEGLVSQ